MSLSPFLLKKANGIYNDNRVETDIKREKQREAYIARSPELTGIDRELRRLSFAMARAALGGNGSDIHTIRENAEALRNKQGDILESKGLPRDYLVPHHSCAICGDSGYVDSKPCSCLMKIYKECLMQSVAEYIGEARFSDFNFDYYTTDKNAYYGLSSRDSAGLVYDRCLTYAKKFRPFSASNLLICGEPGLGKSFLAACIAREVALCSHWVVCLSSIELYSLFDKSRFGRLEQADAEALTSVNECDLLVLDDLGSEAPIQLNTPHLYRLVDSRIATKRNTVIVTGLKTDSLASRYSPQIESRITGLYQQLFLFGEDIRKSSL